MVSVFFFKHCNSMLLQLTLLHMIQTSTDSYFPHTACLHSPAVKQGQIIPTYARNFDTFDTFDTVWGRMAQLTARVWAARKYQFNSVSSYYYSKLLICMKRLSEYFDQCQTILNRVSYNSSGMTPRKNVFLNLKVYFDENWYIVIKWNIWKKKLIQQ